MTRWTLLVLAAALSACGAGDDTAEGTRAFCAEGGALNECRGSADTSREACWKMVDCGAIPLHRDGQFEFDWDRCVIEVERMDIIEQQLVISCINAATCDQLEADGRPCFRLGDN